MTPQMSNPPGLVPGSTCLVEQNRTAEDECRACSRQGAPIRVSPVFVANQDLSLPLCQACFARVTEAVYDPTVSAYLSAALADAIGAAARLAVAADRAAHRSAKQKPRRRPAAVSR